MASSYRGSEDALLLSSLRMTPWFGELLDHLAEHIAGKSQIRYVHK